MPRRPTSAPGSGPLSLTAASVSALPVTGRAYTVRDTQLSGFAVDVGASGKKTFTLDYRVKGDRTKRRMTFGSFPTVKPEQARKAANVAKAAASLGTDPAQAPKDQAAARVSQRQAIKAAHEASVKTVKWIADRYMADSKNRLRSSTYKQYEWLLEERILDSIGDIALGDVTTATIAKLHSSLHETKTAANQCVRLLSTIFRYAERSGERPRGSNPATDVPRYKESLKERFLKPEELQALITALDTAALVGLPAAPARQRKHNPETAKHAPPPKPGKKNIARGEALKANPIAIAAIRLLILTGARKSEILALEWSEVDLSRNLLLLSESKTGRSTRPLSPDAVAILKALPKVEGAKYVFESPTNRTEPIADISRIWDAVRHAAKLREVRLHDLRHTAASLMLQAGATTAEVGRAIGHTSPRSTQRYAHINDAGAHRAATLLAAAVTSASTQTSVEAKESASGETDICH